LSFRSLPALKAVDQFDSVTRDSRERLLFQLARNATIFRMSNIESIVQELKQERGRLDAADILLGAKNLRVAHLVLFAFASPPRRALWVQLIAEKLTRLA